MSLGLLVRVFDGLFLLGDWASAIWAVFGILWYWFHNVLPQTGENKRFNDLKWLKGAVLKWVGNHFCFCYGNFFGNWCLLRLAFLHWITSKQSVMLFYGITDINVTYYNFYLLVTALAPSLFVLGHMVYMWFVGSADLFLIIIRTISFLHPWLYRIFVVGCLCIGQIVFNALRVIILRYIELVCLVQLAPPVGTGNYNVGASVRGCWIKAEQIAWNSVIFHFLIWVI